MLPQLRDLVNRYHPEVLYVDGEWDHNSTFWKTPAFLAWLYNESPVKDTVAVNDRWGNECRGKNGGFWVCEYSGQIGGSCITADPYHPWTTHQGMGHSFGYNRLDKYDSATYLVHLLVQSVAYGGHLQLNVGPRHDGRIPDVQKNLLLGVGDWLAVNGEAIYGSKGFPFGLAGSCREAAGDGPRRCFTQQGADTLYAVYLDWPGATVVVDFGAAAPNATFAGPTAATAVTLLGHGGAALSYTWDKATGALAVAVPALDVDELPCQHAFTFKLTAMATAPADVAASTAPAAALAAADADAVPCAWDPAQATKVDGNFTCAPGTADLAVTVSAERAAGAPRGDEPGPPARARPPPPVHSVAARAVTYRADEPREAARVRVAAVTMGCGAPRGPARRTLAAERS